MNDQNLDKYHFITTLILMAGWILIGFLTAMIRWYWTEGSETIKLRVARQDTESYMDEAGPGTDCKAYYEKCKETAKSNFFFASIISGPIGTIVYIANLSWEWFMKKE